MVVAAVQNTNVHLETQNNSSSHSANDAMDLEHLIDPVSSQDLSTFHATVQQSIQQTTAATPAANSTYSADSMGNVVMNIVDSIQQGREKVSNFRANITSLTVSQTLELQETAESLSLSVQFLSKGVSMATKAIDTLVHMQ